MNNQNKKKDPLVDVLEDITTRIVTIEKDVRRLEDVNVKLINTQVELFAIVKRMAAKILTEETTNNKKKEKNGKRIQRNNELENLYR